MPKLTPVEGAEARYDDTRLGPCEECGTFGVAIAFKGADGRSVCDECRDEADQDQEAHEHSAARTYRESAYDRSRRLYGA